MELFGIYVCAGNYSLIHMVVSQSVRGAEITTP